MRRVPRIALPIVFTLPILLALSLGPAAAAERPVVVELFTSQSCSSCPPAEALIGRLAREGADVLPLAFHVTYWNHLNWRDAYALSAATERQDAYAAQLGGSVYTPQAVVDGRAGLVGSDEAALRGAITRARAEAGAAVPVDVERAGANLAVHVGAGGGAGTILLVGFDPSRTTRVERGENAGRTLAQANVVRALRAIGRWSGSAATITVPAPEGEAAAVLLQADDGRILGAARFGARLADAVPQGVR